VELDTAIASSLSQSRVVIEQLMDAIGVSGFGEGELFGIKLSLEEAFANAIKHGNRFDPEKQVHIQARITPGHLEITVRDEGDGYCPDCVADPTAPCNLEHPGGRGLLLIRAYMDEVIHSDEGRSVRMIKTAATSTQ
jgi:serine/threonine-protein kinase RsbW